jgi:hypothetical protein
MHVYPNEYWATQILAACQPHMDAPSGRRHKATELTMFSTQVCGFGERCEGLGSVVVTADKALRIDIEHLLTAVRVNGVWKPDGKPAPRLTVRLPNSVLAYFVAGILQDKRHGDVRPNRLPGKVKNVQVVPPEQMAKVAERLTGLAPMDNYATVVFLNAYLISFEYAALARLWERLKRHTLARTSHRCVSMIRDLDEL